MNDKLTSLNARVITAETEIVGVNTLSHFLSYLSFYQPLWFTHIDSQMFQFRLLLVMIKIGMGLQVLKDLLIHKITKSYQWMIHDMYCYTSVCVIVLFRKALCA
jgi:hypothetical protein